MQPQLTTMVCGDFNARISSRVPCLDPKHPTRIATDPHVCPRAPWFINICEQYNLYILNGIHTPAAFTCHTGRGQSAIDFVLCNKPSLQVKYVEQQIFNYTDHDLLFTHLPLTANKPTTTPRHPHHHDSVSQHDCITPASPPASKKTQSENENSYRWIPGEYLNEYNTSAAKWKSHTSTAEFSKTFRETAAQFENDNDARAAAIELFMLAEATKAGVVTEIPPRSHKNPNKWAKHLAPWFNETCRNARNTYRATASTHGKSHTSAIASLKNYLKTCRDSRAKMQFTLPDMLKQ
jgi:hypothetical protein